MSGSIYQYLVDDHRRLEELMNLAVSDLDNILNDVYDEFRQGLLQHISIEEKILLPVIQKAQEGKAFAHAARLRLEHGALAALMVPPPSKQIVSAIRAILADHNPIEEDSGGLYKTCERIAGDHIEELMKKIKTLPQVAIMPAKSSPYIIEATMRALARAGYDLDKYC